MQKQEHMEPSSGDQEGRVKQEILQDPDFKNYCAARNLIEKLYSMFENNLSPAGREAFRNTKQYQDYIEKLFLRELHKKGFTEKEIAEAFLTQSSAGTYA